MTEAVNLYLNNKKNNKLKNGNSDVIKITLYKYTLIHFCWWPREKNVHLAEMYQFVELFAESVINFIAPTVDLFQFMRVNVRLVINLKKHKKFHLVISAILVNSFLEWLTSNAIRIINVIWIIVELAFEIDSLWKRSLKWLEFEHNRSEDFSIIL